MVAGFASELDRVIFIGLKRVKVDVSRSQEQR